MESATASVNSGRSCQGDGGGSRLRVESTLPAPATEAEPPRADGGRAGSASLLRRGAAQQRAARWRCRVCLVECGGRDGLRAHCMSDEHYDGLQLFCLHPMLFQDHRHVGR